MASGFQRRRVNNHPLRCSKMQHLVAENSSSKKTPRCRSCGRKRMRKAGRAGGRAGSVEDKAKAGRAASPSKKREKKIKWRHLLRGRVVFRSSMMLTISTSRTVLKRWALACMSSGVKVRIGTMKFHTGVPSARRWMTPQNELAFLAAARELELWARGASQGASRVMETLEELEGLGNYSYHVLRSWGACCTAMHNRKVPGWKPRAVDDDGSDLRVKQRNPHFQLALV